MTAFMLKKTAQLTKRFKTALVEIKLRLDRGNSLIYWFRNIIFMVAALRIIYDFSTLELILIGVALILAIYFLGKLDLDYFKFYQKEQELNTSKYNPHLNKLRNI